MLRSKEINSLPSASKGLLLRVKIQQNNWNTIARMILTLKRFHCMFIQLRRLNHQEGSLNRNLGKEEKEDGTSTVHSAITNERCSSEVEPLWKCKGRESHSQIDKTWQSNLLCCTWPILPNRPTSIRQLFPFCDSLRKVKTHDRSIKAIQVVKMVASTDSLQGDKGIGYKLVTVPTFLFASRKTTKSHAPTFWWTVQSSFDLHCASDSAIFPPDHCLSV